MTKKTLTIPQVKNFLIVGAGDPVKTFIKKIKKIFPDSKVFILSDKSCDRSWSVFENIPIDQVAKNLNYDIKYINEINSATIIKEIKNRGCNICFVIGSRWILKSPLIKIFNGLIFNYHTSDLPNYQGGGGYRWQIMNEEKNIYIAFHQLTEKIDRGAIVAVHKRELKLNEGYPRDIFKELFKFTSEVFDDFLEKLKSKTYSLTIQDPLKGSYFPLLDNDINGAIDLNWSKKDIKLFIDAFSYPYKGAFLFYKEKKFYIQEIEISKRNYKFHPFVIGLIINRTNNYIEIVTKDGSVLLKKILDTDENVVGMDNFKVGNRFYIDNETLLKAKLYRPSNKNFLLKTNNN